MKRVIINNIRNIKSLDFIIPNPGVYIITGKNGTGKTTLFTCLNRIGNRNAFREGFLSSEKFDEVKGTITYQIDEESVAYDKRKNGRWRPNHICDILKNMRYPQVVNITTKNDRIFTQEEIVPRKSKKSDTWINEQLNRILETDRFTNMVQITTGQLYCGRGKSVENRRRNIAYAIPIGNNQYYTERNFSFGEIVLLNMLYDIKNVTNGSLILIDELELALHPSAQIRLISCLRELAKEKGLTLLISTHSSSIIRNERKVILLEDDGCGNIDIIDNCPPAKAIGAIGMREDTMPDVIVLVEDSMARALFDALKQKYFQIDSQNSYLDIRVLEIGGFTNVINFYTEANNYVFYKNVYLAAFMDKDVETDIIPYSQYGNQTYIQKYQENSYYLNFLPYTPEVFLAKILFKEKIRLLNKLKDYYSNQQIDYTVNSNLNFTTYESDFPEFNSQDEYNAFIKKRGQFRDACKSETKTIAKSISDQLNISENEVYRFVFNYAINTISNEEINVQSLLARVMKRSRKTQH